MTARDSGALELFLPEPLPDRPIVIGTSGYSFPDWIGPFYPPGIRASEQLGFYARHFSAVEVNATYYRPPDTKMMQQMERKTPEGFRFVVKLHRSMTHEGAREPALYRDFIAAMRPLKDAGKFDGLLAQFPWAFHNDEESRAHLAAMRERLEGETLFAEFRHDSWAAPDLESMLRGQRIGFCAVDEPRLKGLMPPIVLRTAEDAYVRFHGRNAGAWWGRSGTDDRQLLRYDYSYRADELAEWTAKVAALAEQARRTYLFFNNCHAGQAARSAKLMQELLRQQNLPA
ncbi:MAG: DUF72 domain-containing protein [Candidatus Eisenbacteria bacterium]|uniref:DUF72 domain-containing protein n=1 Tax=Eiseniibacteriota bacterium TaxID=2212470 RepID=A0A9D6L784_UNCEI|nr:DUF72 domain-containing protein [Candidatus Eisenbacteria bacterium]MBI3540208.1 DUF72 domain-containing protein [Candidatus Eisenbacteria bacterium]